MSINAHCGSCNRELLLGQLVQPSDGFRCPVCGFAFAPPTPPSPQPWAPRPWPRRRPWSPRSPSYDQVLIPMEQAGLLFHERVLAWKRAAGGHRGPAGVSQTVARGGRVTRAEAGWPAQSISSASTTPMAGTSEPP
jgi:hypothetical protein